MEKEPRYVMVTPSTWQEKLRKALVLIGTIIAALTGTTTVSMQGCRQPPLAPPTTTPSTSPTTPIAPPGPDVPANKIDPVNAVVQIQFGNAGCSATVVGPQLPDGRWQLVSAAHCFTGQPREGTARFRDGRTLRIVLQKMEERTDVAWCVTELPTANVPHTMLAEKMPVAGDKVYHCGYGVHVPGNREEGTVVSPDSGGGQTQYRLSVSSGDSGGGIALTAEGHVLSPVCCTTGKGRMADVWGASVDACKRTRPRPVPVHDEWTPIDIPIRMPEK